MGQTVMAGQVAGTGQVVTVQVDDNGVVQTNGTGGGGGAGVAAADAVANPTAVQGNSFVAGFNGATWDRLRAGLAGVKTSVLGFLNVIPMAQFNATPPAPSDGNVVNLQATSTGALRIGRVDCELVSLDVSVTPSNAPSTTTAGAPLVGLADIENMHVFATLQGSTGGTLDIYLQRSPDGGSTWIDWLHFPQVLAGASAVNSDYVPSLTAVNVTPVGKGTTASPGVALAANTFVGGHPGDQLRAVAVTGSGVSASVAQTIKIHGIRAKH